MFYSLLAAIGSNKNRTTYLSLRGPQNPVRTILLIFILALAGLDTPHREPYRLVLGSWLDRQPDR